MKFKNIQMEYSKMRSEPSLPHVFKRTSVILIHLENYLEVWVHERHAKEVWDRNWMNLDMHTMRLDAKLLNAMSLKIVRSNIDGEDSEETSFVNTPKKMTIGTL